MKSQLALGQTLYRLNVGNNARACSQRLTPVIVTKIGRKYFTVKNRDGGYAFEVEFLLDDWRERTEYTENHALYSSPQAWEDEKEVVSLCADFSKAFQHGSNRRNLTIDALRAVRAIVFSGEKKP